MGSCFRNANPYGVVRLHFNIPCLSLKTIKLTSIFFNLLPSFRCINSTTYIEKQQMVYYDDHQKHWTNYFVQLCFSGDRQPFFKIKTQKQEITMNFRTSTK